MQIAQQLPDMMKPNFLLKACGLRCVIDADERKQLSHQKNTKLLSKNALFSLPTNLNQKSLINQCFTRQIVFREVIDDFFHEL